MISEMTSLVGKVHLSVIFISVKMLHLAFIALFLPRLRLWLAAAWAPP